ncbi:MAG: GNAT family N-acyltransferase [Pseudomonadota bacterium]
MALVEESQNRIVDIKVRDLRIRLAESRREIEAAQELRYQVFYESMDATATDEMVSLGRDFDSYDDFCDHLLVFDETQGASKEAVVGTYRLMRRDGARRRGQFYSSDEFDLGVLQRYPGEIMELGRSCVHTDYRTGTTMQLLWRGIAAYVFHHDIDLMFGCASLPGTDPDQLRDALAYLRQHHLAPPALRARAQAGRYLPMDPSGTGPVDVQKARQMLPPLLKGYLRLGGFVGDGAVIDPEFGTTDVCVVVKTDWVTEKYYRHYRREEPGGPNDSPNDHREAVSGNLPNGGGP